MPGYTPRPIDTSNVALPPELDALLEYLAQNVHEVWASRRLAEGWRYGPDRNDTRKEHPCLVPYDQLSESEREYDRATARETLRAILALGFRIEREWS
ncbi:MAG: RyR domain-containing protein [Chloroflexota bacterium]|nr:RyR domain-containing protein [Chloroflexota bacterium]